MYTPTLLFSYLSSASSVIAGTIPTFPASVQFIQHRINHWPGRNVRSLIDHFFSALGHARKRRQPGQGR